MLRHNSHAVHTDQLSCCWFIGSRKVEQVVQVVPTFACQVLILSFTDHLAAMGDGLHVILIFMTRLVQGILEREEKEL